MADRKAELEKKRKKLDELRKAREVTKKETSFKEVKRLHTGNKRYEMLALNKFVDNFPSRLHSAFSSPFYTHTQSLSKSPTPSDSLAKKREDVNKIVTDLLGPTVSTPSRSPHKSPEPEASGEEKTTPISVSPRKRAVKLVVDTMAPINIHPRVSWK